MFDWIVVILIVEQKKHLKQYGNTGRCGLNMARTKLHRDRSIHQVEFRKKRVYFTNKIYYYYSLGLFILLFSSS